MDAKLQRRVQRYGWDKAAAHYEKYWQRQLAPAQDRLLELAELKPGDRVLDIACGTGLVTFPAARAVAPNGSVVATDISDAMVEHVKAEAGKRGLQNVTAERMDAEELRFPDGSFDVVLCALGLMYVPDPLASLRETYRVLRSGGRAVVAVWGARNRCGWAEIFPIVESRISSEVCPLFFQLGTQDNLRLTMEQAGFRDVVVDRIATTLRYESGEDACGAAFAGGPVALAYSRFDEPTRDEAHAEYLASIESSRRGSGYEIPGEFVVALAHRKGADK
ncbi:MAG: class I SAM-dependent methyltransferase [Gemmatimonadaceae bacterium]